MVERPTGTVTFLFTDVENSTRLWQDHPAAMSSALGEHDAVVRAEVTAHDGHVFSTAGDPFGVAFGSSIAALNAAVGVQRALASREWGSTPILVRMGVHVGQATERDGDYFGTPVNRAARIMSLAVGGAILVSAAISELVRDSSESSLSLDDLDFVDMGDHSLKSLSRPERLFQVVGPGLAPKQEVHSELESALGNLPLSSTLFIGREDAIDRLRESLSESRLTTVTGIGGGGKTRLALEVADPGSDAYPDGVWFADLTALTSDDADTLAVFLASMLGVMQQPAMTSTESIVDALKRRRLLLILDNCEHVLTASASVAAAILAACEHVTLLATSREPLRIAGERVWPIAPLSVETDAVELLIDRVRAADASIDVSGWDPGELARLCERLDGIPLAIEMAAARLRSLSVTEVLQRLEDRFRLLRRPKNAGDSRHQTLVATLDWSYEALGPTEQRLLGRLSVFVGSFDLRGVEAVCTDEDVDELDIVDLLGALVDRSLVVLLRSETGQVRYRLLETVRQYGAAQLDAQSETGRFRRRHVGYHRELVVQADKDHSSEHDYWSGRHAYDHHWDDLLEALQFAIVAGDTDSANEIFHSTAFYASLGLRFELGRLARQALDMAEPPPAAFSYAAIMAGFVGDFAEQISLAETGLDLANDAESRDAYIQLGPLFGGLSVVGDPRAHGVLLRILEHDMEPVGRVYWTATLRPRVPAGVRIRRHSAMQKRLFDRLRP